MLKMEKHPPDKNKHSSRLNKPNGLFQKNVYRLYIKVLIKKTCFSF